MRRSRDRSLSLATPSRPAVRASARVSMPFRELPRVLIDRSTRAPAKASESTPAHVLARARMCGEALASSQFGVAFDKRALGVLAQGELIAIVAGFSIVITAPWVPTANISLCGFLEYASNAMALPYYASASASATSATWSARAMATRERTFAMASARALCGASIALGAFGVLLAPRCLWSWHQAHVHLFMISVTLAMAFEASALAWDVAMKKPMNERVVASALVIPQVAWVWGIITTRRYYYDSTERYEFFVAEIVCMLAFAWWAFSKHRAGTFPGRAEGRVYTWREYCLIDGAIGATLLCASRFMQFKVCKTWGQYGG